jgi:hypothetical protein
MTAIRTRTRSRVHVHRDRLVRRLALRGLLFLALAELLALAARVSGAPVTGWPSG